jgi:membrane-associated phospholipid phosphatase
MVISMIALAVAGRRVEAWRAAFSFIGSLSTICLIAILTPAKGIGLWAPPQLLKHLPDGAMRYFWGNFDAFYAGTNPVLSLGTIDGVISFPSLHAAMGFTTVAMWRKNPLCLGLALLWLTFMLLATFPYGGHYVVDVLAGLAVAAGWFALSRRLEGRRRRTATDALVSAIEAE